LIRRKKESKRIFFSVLFIITIFVANVQILDSFNVFSDEKINNLSKENLFNDPLQLSNLNLDDDITGTGVNQTVRIYVNNNSENLQDNEQYFEIPSLATDDMYLTYGDFNFTFQNNYTTDYIIEDDDALYASDFIDFDYKDNPYSNVTISNGTISGGTHGNFLDGLNSTNVVVSGAQNDIINFTVTANFTDTEHSIATKGNVEFNRSKILGLIFSMVYELNSDANLTVKIKDNSRSTWKDIITSISINSSLGIQDINQRLINGNLNFTSIVNCSYFQFIFERWDKEAFDATLYNFNLIATQVFDLPITNTSYVALEMDLKGLNSTVNGFYAWIRTLDFVEAANTHLNITLYRANDTVVRTDTNLRTAKLIPNYNDMIDTYLMNYTNDKLTYFKFNVSNTGSLNLSNYFIVIKSNSSKEVYSLVSLPFYDYGDDGSTEHQLKTTNDDGVIWTNAIKSISTTGDDYTSGQLDASSFKLNVTRGYIPTDFIVNGTNTLRIQNLTINDYEISSSPYDESSYLTWGLGQWNYNFTSPIEDEGKNRFRVNLTWDKNITTSFKFNVSYSVKAYWTENATTTYTANYNKDPEWVFNFNLDNKSQKFSNWSFIEFWFVYADFFTARNLTNPKSEQILNKTGGPSLLSGDSNNYKLIINNTLSILNGPYILNLTNFNFIDEMHSYIDYNGTLWETRGFMYGDNISTNLKIQNQKLKAPVSGIANVTLFYPNKTEYTDAKLTSSSGSIKSSGLLYDFNNETILDLTNNIEVLGEYYLGFFWFNGSAIGCKKIIIYIDTYDVDLYGLNYDPNLRTNVLSGEVKNPVYDNYTLLVASVNETTGIVQPNFYPINNDDILEQFSQDIGGEQLPVLINSFKQSETIINPNETINIQTSVKNLHPFIPVEVKINLKLVSYANEEWIIAENTSSSVLLNFSGLPDDTFEFDLNLKIPDLDINTQIWQGLNGPIRLAGAKTLITVIIEDSDAGTYEYTEYSLLSNKSNNEFEGHILGLRVAEEVDIRSILYEFLREECIYYPNDTTFLVNIFDQNYVSSYTQFDNKFTLKLNSKFINISFSPNTPIEGHELNISAILSTEFEDVLVNKNVSCDYYYSNSWYHIGSDFTDTNGVISFVVNTLYVNFEDDLLIRLLWEGDDIVGISRNVSITLIPESNSLSISLSSDVVQIYRNKDTTFSIILNNLGDSILRIIDISIELNPNLPFTIVEIDYILQSWLQPGERTNIIVLVEIGNSNSLEFNITITAQNIMTNENFTISNEQIIPVFQTPVTDYFIEFFVIIIGVCFAIAWIGAVLYSRRTIKRIQTPVEKIVKKRPRRGKYVSVSELKKPTPVKKMPKKPEVTKEVEQKSTMDLDSLLEERGLDDKKKKSKK